LIIAIPEALREKLGPEGARALADLLNEASVQTRGDVIEIAASRFERRLAEQTATFETRLAELTARFEGRLAEQTAKFERRLAEETGKLRAEIGELRADMGAFEARITRWMFVFWVGQIGVLLGIIFAFFRP
jgi:ABC-type Zn2+ transport system substrate-binding protein/surface adhesin